MKALVLNGTVGVGKTSVSETIGELLRIDGVPNAVIDLDGLRNAWPAPSDDRFNERLALSNLAALAVNFGAAEMHLLVIAAVVETRAFAEAIQGAIAGDIWLCRLTVDAVDGEGRLRRRHQSDEEAREWHLDRFGELDSALNAAALDDTVLDTTGKPIAEVAREVLGRYNGLPTR